MAVEPHSETIEPALYPPHAEPAELPLSFFRFLARFVRNPLTALPRQVYKDPIVTMDSKDGGIAWIADPALVETVLLTEHERFPKTSLDRRALAEALGEGILTSQGALWRWQRKIAAPLFRHADILASVPQMARAAEDVIETWRGLPPGALHDVQPDMTRATFAVIASTILAGLTPEESETLRHEGEAFLEPVSWPVAYGMVGLPEWLWHPGKGRRSRAARLQRGAVRELIARRRRETEGGTDILARFLAARDPETGEAMPDERIIDNLATFIAAGHETTARALTWALYLLARAPAWQARIREEVETVVGAAPLAPSHIDALPVTARVMKEVLRLYPPAPVTSRYTAEAVDLGGTHLKKGVLIVIPIYAVHRNARLWQDPHRFDPDRFLPEREAQMARAQFMPFGFGPRICIGTAFAMIEAVSLLASFLRAAEFHWDGKHLPEPVSRVTLRPKGGMTLGIRIR